MATLRGSASNSYQVGNRPPGVSWTLVRGDTAAFKVYVTDDAQQPLVISDFNISMEIKRPEYTVNENNIGTITDDAETILTLTPEQDPDDASGEFTVSLSAGQSSILETGDIFDIELRSEQDQIVWTVAQGYVVVIEDVTN
jgi:hypothetical protein